MLQVTRNGIGTLVTGVLGFLLIATASFIFANIDGVSGPVMDAVYKWGPTGGSGDKTVGPIPWYTLSERRSVTAIRIVSAVLASISTGLGLFLYSKGVTSKRNSLGVVLGVAALMWQLSFLRAPGMLPG
jgi:hypothetical protein